MVKKLLVGMLFVCSVMAIRADVQDEIAPLLQRIEIALFLLEGNTLRMERYGLHEISSEMTSVCPEVSLERTVFKIGLTDGPSCAGIVSWDTVVADRIKIIAGQKRSLQTFFLPLTKIINQTVCLDSCVMLCFDCVVNQIQGDGEQANKKLSVVEIMVPVADAQETMKFVFEGVVDAACGMFVQNDLFQGSVPVCGELKKEDALALGVLVEQQGAARGTDITEQPCHQKISAFESVKMVFFRSLSAIKNFCNTTWQKIFGSVGSQTAK